MEGVGKGSRIAEGRTRISADVSYRQWLMRFDLQRFGEQGTIRTVLEAAKAELKIKGELVYPPPRLDFSAFVFDEAHTQSGKHPHAVTEQEARQFIDEAYFAIVRYNGNSYNYYGRNGATFVRMDLKTLRTAFKSEEYDDNIRTLIRYLKMQRQDDAIKCPLLAKEIPRLTCEDVALSAEGMQPVRFAPQEFRDVLNWKERCLNCPKHPE